MTRRKPAQVAELDGALAAGVRHFNELEFWEAHEAWEALWLEADDERAEFYQGLIQLAAAYHHMKRGTFPGAVRLFDAALTRLSAFPPLFLGIARDAAVAAAEGHRGSAESRQLLGIGDYPKLSLDGG